MKWIVFKDKYSDNLFYAIRRFIKKFLNYASTIGVPIL